MNAIRGLRRPMTRRGPTPIRRDEDLVVGCADHVQADLVRLRCGSEAILALGKCPPDVPSVTPPTTA